MFPDIQLFAYIMTYEKIPQMIVVNITSLTDNVLLILLICNIILFIAGMFMESTALFLILIPLHWSLVQSLGINVVHFGMIATVNIAIGLVTPPFGVCMFTAASIGKIRVEQLSREVIPFIGVMLIAQMVITYLPLLFY